MMLDSLKWRQVKDNASPGSLIYAGPAQTFTPTICRCSYNTDEVEDVCYDSDARPETDAGHTHFLRLVGIHSPDAVRRVGQWLDIHPLLLEDIMNSGHRPKLEIDDNGLFLALKDIHFDKESMRTEHHQVGIYWRDNVVCAFQEAQDEPWAGVLKRIHSGLGRIRSAGPAYLVIALVDGLIDSYFTVLNKLSGQAEDLEESMAQRQTEDALMQLYALKREAVLLRSIFIPVRDMLQELEREDLIELPEAAQPFLTDVREHAQQVVDTVTALHEILSSMLDVQISLAGMRMNSVMKVLTTIATIFIPLTFLAGIYGMNFDYMPELHYHYAYPVVLAVMGALVGGMVWYFKRKDWF